jgi:periplasmic protein CpxP/Spy
MSTKFIKQGLVAALLLVCATPVLTRAQGTPQDSGQQQASPAQDAPKHPDLNLTDDQKAQMNQIHENAKSQIEAVKNDSSLSDAQKKAKIGQIHRDTHKQVEAMLTPEQRKTMREWRREHHGEHQQQPPSGK